MHGAVNAHRDSKFNAFGVKGVITPVVGVKIVHERAQVETAQAHGADCPLQGFDGSRPLVHVDLGITREMFRVLRYHFGRVGVVLMIDDGMEDIRRFEKGDEFFEGFRKRRLEVPDLLQNLPEIPLSNMRADSSEAIPRAEAIRGPKIRR